MPARLILALYALAARIATDATLHLAQAAHRADQAGRGGLRRIRPAIRPGVALPAFAVALIAVGLVGALAITTSVPPPPAARAASRQAAADNLTAQRMEAVMLVTPPPPPNPRQEHAAAASTYQRHLARQARARHLTHLRDVRLARQRAVQAAAAAAAASASASASAAAASTSAATSAAPAPTPTANAPPPASSSYGSVLSYAQLEQIWVQAGGPAAAEATAATIAECESGGNTHAYNASGASGLWQILGVPFPGDPFDALTNARMAVAKYNGAGGFSPWVCQG